MATGFPPLLCVHDPSGTPEALALWAWPVLESDHQPSCAGYYSAGQADDEGKRNAVLPSGWRQLAAGSDPLSLLRAVQALHPGRDLLLIQAGADLPKTWWTRLSAAAAGSGTDLITPLDASIPMLDPDPADLIAELDQACWHYGEHALCPTSHVSTGLSWWRGDAIDKVPPSDRPIMEDFRVPDGLSARVLPCLCVRSPTSAARTGMAEPGLPVLAVRERLERIASTPLRGRPGADGKPVVLHVLHGWGGGAARFVRDLAAADDQRRHLALVAQSDPDRHCHGIALALHADLDAPPLALWPLAAPIADSALASDEYRQILDQVIERWAVSAVLVSSLIGHSLDALRTGLSTAVCCHDHYPLWPWLDETFEQGSRFDTDALRVRMCADPPPQFGNRDPEHWLRLRQRYLTALSSANAMMVSPSRSGRRNLCRIEPSLENHDWRVIGHGLADWPDRASPCPVTNAARGKLRVLVPGRIAGGKGEHLLAELIGILPDRIELVLLGAGAAGKRFFGASNVHVIQDYQRGQLPGLIARLQPDLALLASTTAETWSYTLSEMWSLGVPVMATERGSFAERIEHGRTGLLVAPKAGAILAQLGILAADPTALRAIHPGPVETVASMAEAWREALPATPRRTVLISTAGAEGALRMRLHLDLARYQARIVELDGTIALQQAELDARADWASDLEAQLAERADQGHHFGQQLVQLHGELAERQRLLEQSLAERDALRLDTDRLESQLAQAYSLYDRDSADLARQRDVALAQRDGLQTQVQTLLRSQSWRLTAPLRAARRSVGNLQARVGFRWRQLRNLSQRGLLSLRSRGVHPTLTRLAREFIRPTRPGGSVVGPGKVDLRDLHLPCPERPAASIIIPAYNQLAHTLACLRSLAESGDATAFEVIVVDDQSSDETPRTLAGIAGLRWHRNERNLGFIGACNAGSVLARGEFLVFLNNDTLVRPGWLDALIGTFASQPRAGLVGAKLIYPDGRLQEAGGLVFSDGSGWNIGRFEDPDDPRYNTVREVDYCSGAAIAVRRDLFTELGGFDPRYAPAYYEDTDLAMKLRARGLKVIYQPRAEVVHCEGISHGTDLGSGVKSHQVRNQALFLERWRDVLLRDHAAPGARIEQALERHCSQRVLVIDACTPTPDRDSGSLRMINLLRLLREEGCAVSFFADNRSHDGAYSQALQQLGVEVWWHPYIGNPATWLGRHGPRMDLIIVSRHYIASAYLPLLRQYAPQARVVFDTVDLHYLREQREAELGADVRLARRAAQTRRQELAVIADSDLTLVVSTAEQALLARELPDARVAVLSNVHAIAGDRTGFEDRHGLVFVGGFRHPPNVDAAVWFAESVFPLIHARAPDIALHLIGADAPESVQALAERPGIHFHGYVPDIEPFMTDCRVALAPLRYGAGVKGKINLSMAHGQPVVATTCAVEGMHLRDGEDVLVADAPEAFAEAVLRLHGDAGLWRRLSENGVENVRRHFSFDAARLVLRRELLGTDPVASGRTRRGRLRSV